MTDLQANLVTRLQGNGLQQGERQSRGFTESLKRLKGEARDTQQQLDRTFNSAKEKSEQARKASERFGQALTRLGGPVGALGGKLGSSAGGLFNGAGGTAGAVAGPVGVVLAAAAAGMKVLSTLHDSNIDKAKRLASAEREVAEAIHRAAEARRASAGEGRSQADDYRFLLGVGGKDAVEDVQRYARAGFDYQQTVRAARTSYGKFGKNGGATALGLASAVAGTGVVTIDQAAEQISGAGALPRSAAGADAMIRMIYRRATGRQGTDREIDEAIRAGGTAVARDPYTRAVERQNGIRSQIPAFQQLSTITDGDDQAHRELRAAADPAGVALDELRRTMALNNAELRRIADAEDKSLQALLDVFAPNGALGLLGSLIGKPAIRGGNRLGFGQSSAEELRRNLDAQTAAGLGSN